MLIYFSFDLVGFGLQGYKPLWAVVSVSAAFLNFCNAMQLRPVSPTW
jgi:hypothetical protein